MKENTIYWIIGILVVLFLINRGPILSQEELFAVSTITNSEIIPKNIMFVKDGIIYLDGNVLDFELVDNANPTCVGSSLTGIIQQRVKLNNEGYRCSGIPPSPCRGDSCGETGLICLNQDGISIGCPLSECSFDLELSNELPIKIYDVNVDLGLAYSSSTFCDNSYISKSANFKIAITGTGYNLINNECALVSNTIPEYLTLEECKSNIIEEEITEETVLDATEEETIEEDLIEEISETTLETTTQEVTQEEAKSNLIYYIIGGLGLVVLLRLFKRW